MNNDIIIILPNLCCASLQLGWFTDKLRYGDGDEYSCVWLLSACQYHQHAEYLRLAHHRECSPAPNPPPTRLVASSSHFLPLCNKDVCPTDSSFQTFIGQ